MTKPTLRRFPAPWTVVELQEAFWIRGRQWVRLELRLLRRSKNEAHRIAINRAAVPELRGALRDHEKRF